MLDKDELSETHSTFTGLSHGNLLVSYEVGLENESFPALDAFLGLLACESSSVYRNRVVAKGVPTDSAFKGF